MIALTIDPMASVLSEATRERYWGQVYKYLSDVFELGPDDCREVVGRYEAVVNDSPIGEQVAVYHAEPIETAYDLAVQAAQNPDDGLQVPNLKTLRERYESFEMIAAEVDVYRP